MQELVDAEFHKVRKTGLEDAELERTKRHIADETDPHRFPKGFLDAELL